MVAQPEREEYQLSCPLCGHPAQVARHGGDACRYCGAQFMVFNNEQAANGFAESLKTQHESVQCVTIPNSPLWLVGHKGNPTQDTKTGH